MEKFEQGCEAQKIQKEIEDGQIEYQEGEVAESKRRGAERDKDKTMTASKVEGAIKEGGVETSIDQAKEIMGNSFYGPEEIASTFGFEIKKETIPQIPYSPEDLEKAAQLGEKLILRISHDSEGNPMTMQRMNQIMAPRLAEDETGKLLYNNDWYKEEDFYTKDSLKMEWRLVGGSFVPDVNSEKDREDKYTEDSSGKNYIQQTRLLRDYLKSIDSLTEEEEMQCADENLRYLADEMGMDWGTGNITDQTKYEANWKRVTLELSNLLINTNHRRSSAEIIYDFSVQSNKSKDGGVLKFNYDWSRDVSSGGSLVGVGGAGAIGARVNRWLPVIRSGNLGVVSLR